MGKSSAARRFRELPVRWKAVPTANANVIPEDVYKRQQSLHPDKIVGKGQADTSLYADLETEPSPKDIAKIPSLL